MKHQKSVKLGDSLKEKCLCITVTLGPFESRSLHITTAVGAPLKARYFVHYSCKGGPEASASLAFP